MHIRGVEFPSELIEAHRAGELVIFAGAGVSMSPPSSLPSFEARSADLPWTAEQLHALIDSDPTAALAQLAELEDKVTVGQSRDTDWYDVAELVSGVVREHPADGTALLSQPGVRLSIALAVVNAWTFQIDDAVQAQELLDRIEAVDLGPVTVPLVRLLDGRLPGDFDWAESQDALHLSERLWTHAVLLPPEEDGPAAQLVSFWMNVVFTRWQADRAGWNGLPDDLRDLLGSALGGPHRDSVATVLTAQLAFYYSADPAWAASRLLPLFDWSEPDRAAHTWTGFLRWGRPSRELVDGPLLVLYQATMGHWDALSEESRKRYLQHLLLATQVSDFDPLPWIQQVIARAEPAERVHWVEQVEHLLRAQDPEVVERYWERWIGTYWQSRLRSVPLSLTTEESSVMCTWVPYLTDSVREGVDLATQHEAGLAHATGVLSRMREDQVRADPRVYGRWLAHLVDGTKGEDTPWRYVQRILGWLKDDADPADVAKIRNGAMQRGVTSAATW